MQHWPRIGFRHRPEGLKFQNIALATVTGLAVRSFQKQLTADVPYGMNKCESLGLGKQLILHGRNPSAIAKDFSLQMAVLRRHFVPHRHFQCCMILQGTLGGNFDIFAANGESLGAPLENPFKTNWREGFVL